VHEKNISCPPHLQVDVKNRISVLASLSWQKSHQTASPSIGHGHSGMDRRQPRVKAGAQETEEM